MAPTRPKQALSVVVLLLLGLAVSGMARAGGGSSPPVQLVSYRYVGSIVSSASMEPTLHCANRSDPGGCRATMPDLLLEEESGARLVRRGDLIAFHLPQAASRYCTAGGEAVKRVIGIGGDLVVVRHGIVSVNGRRLYEPYVPKSERDRVSGRWAVPKGSFFVMGDNRRVSCDSRFWGPLSASRVIGRVVEIIRPSPGGSDPVGPPVRHVPFPWTVDRMEDPSMQPLLKCPTSAPFRSCTSKFGDLVVVELSGGRAIHHGEVIYFRLPRAAKQFCGKGDSFVRVIGVAGDRVTEKAGTVSVNGRTLQEPYVAKRNRDSYSGSWRVPSKSVFVMSDNRHDSCDSRLWGPLRLTLVRGRVVEIVRTLG